MKSEEDVEGRGEVEVGEVDMTTTNCLYMTDQIMGNLAESVQNCVCHCIIFFKPNQYNQ